MIRADDNPLDPEGRHCERASKSSHLIRQIVLSGVICGSLFILVGCISLSEDAQIAAIAPPAFKGDGESGEAPCAQWWTQFHDPQLNQLMSQIESDNFQLRAGIARIDRAYSVLGVARSELVPNVNGSASVLRNRTSENDPGGSFFKNLYTQYKGALATRWEVDLWGRVRNSVNGAKADAANVEQLTNDLRLSLQSQLAQNYFTLRFLDEEKHVLDDAVETRQANLKLAEKQFESGLNNQLDVARAKNELATTRADRAKLGAPRIKLENAIAVLVGDASSCFKIGDEKLAFRLPEIRAGVPLSVLGNRPDVAAAVAKLQSTSARIGVARAEFFPRLDLIGNGGLSSISSSDFFDWSSRTFTIGPEVTLPIFQGGRLKANLMGARAAQAEALADYQQTVLEALREVDDALADLATLRAEREAQLLAVEASDQAVNLSGIRYEQGLVSSIEVVDAVREQLTARRRSVQIRREEYVVTVQLIQAIGGGIHCQFFK